MTNILNFTTKYLLKISAISFLIIVFLLRLVFAEQLAIKNFSITEGLSRNQTFVIYPDSRGFVWIGTADGLSRFDGYGFTNYNTRHGLPNSLISGFAETENGLYWVATHAGLCLINFNQPLDENGKLHLQMMNFGNTANLTIFSIHLDKEKNLWAGTQEGIFKISKSGNEYKIKRVSLETNQPARREGVGNFITDTLGNLWVVNSEGLFRIDKEEKITRYQLSFNQFFDRLGNIALDSKGRLWIGGLDGLYVLMPPKDEEKLKQIKENETSVTLPKEGGEFAVFDEKSGLNHNRILEVFISSDNEIWLSSRQGVSVFDGENFRKITTQNGLISNEILCFGEDPTGNIWIGTESTGVMRVARNGFVTYTQADGLPDNRISSVFEGSDGEIYVIGSNRNISRFDNGKFTTVKPNFPSEIKGSGWSWQHPVIQDSYGEWWIATSQGVVRFPKVSRIEELAQVFPLAVYNSTNGLKGDQVYRLYEDSQSNIWISNLAPPAAGLARWERATGKLQDFTPKSNENQENRSVYSFAEDSLGNLWVGFSNGEFGSIKDGNIEILKNIENLPETIVYDILKDQRGNLWLATAAGAYYLEKPESETLKFTRLTTAQGLSSNDIISITDDLNGRIYFATSQGVQRFDPETKRIELFTTADGIANSELRTAMRSRDGSLWFGTIRGLTRFNPSMLKEIQSPAPIFIQSVKVGGKNIPISELGEEILSKIEILPNQNHLEIEVFGLSLVSGDILKYQYRLGENSEWNEPSDQKTFTLVNLQPGNYEFQARVANSNGLVSPKPVIVSFTVQAPFYRQWWFITAFILIICGLAYLFYRSRIKRLIELEKIRLNIATDLHDDIGSSLSQISLISEVLVLKSNDDGKEPLETISKTAREAVGSMSEMVWAIDPKRDNLPDTIQRMRHYASETLTAANIELSFPTPVFDKNIKFDVDIRRHIYLIFKEAINNAVKHSDASKISIEFIKSGTTLILTIIDDGKGFTETENYSGNGLNNIRLRAKKLGGSVEIISKPEQGTTITLRIPLQTGNIFKFAT